MMEIKELQHFIAIIRYGSFSNAAANIYVSQPTLSKSIQKLEQKLKVTLFERSTRKLVLTDAGEIVYEEAMKILGKVDELKSSLDDLKNSPSGEIKIGVPPLIGTLFFPKIAQDFSKLYPQISLTLVEHGSRRIEHLVEDGEVDVGIVVLPVDQNIFTSFSFISEEFVAFTGIDHPLAKRDKIALNELKDEEFILFNSEFALHELIIQSCHKAGFNPKIPYESSQWDLISELVTARLGVTLLPKSIYKKMNKDAIQMIPLTSPPMWNLGIITKRDRYLSFAVRSLLHFLNKNE